MTESYEERRIAPRSNIEDTLFIKSISSSQVTGYGSDLKTCSTINVSAHGLQVELDFEVLVESEIALWVSHETETDRILVSGIVRWTNKISTENKYLVGIELDDSCVTDMTEWLGSHAS
ncbi:hypothetical protein A9Q99_26300 [Gammaproteobacteria bacterium 45_16_T64]|nr:hypothetical protein A9Q99_26300 [Gammaproteobacteria bacterium 45_16_T64]